MADEQPTPERWLPVVGYEGSYEVSDHGRMRSLDRVSRGRDGIPRKQRGALMNPPTSGRYQIVFLHKDGEREQEYVHRVVARAFLGECPPGLVVCHWNDNGVDNRLSNIRYGTPGDNVQDALRNGRNVNARKTHCKRGHEFTEANTTSNGTPHGRACLACVRTRAFLQRRPEMKPHQQQISDDYYVRIIA